MAEPVAAATTAASTPAAGSSEPASSEAGVRKIDSAPVEPIDLLETAAAPVAKRLLPVLGVVVLLLVIWRVLRRRG